MLLIDPQGNYPRYIGDLMLSNPDWIVGDSLPDGWALVNPSEIPAYDLAAKRLVELYPITSEDGQYYQSWSLEDIPPVADIEFRLRSMGLPDEMIENFLP